MTSLMGLPQSLQDSQIHDELPLFPSSPQKLIALNLQKKMCHIIAEVNNSESSSVFGYTLINGRC